MATQSPVEEARAYFHRRNRFAQPRYSILIVFGNEYFKLTCF